ncbi:hypothetical protein [Acidovorax sp. LjRoot194]|uniref:hypothetical protein n=1 Tax=Acidovorax sp. LjRoot194 TaxID=3342280 RepID=UPI003ED0B9FF
MSKTVIKCTGVTLAVENVGDEVRVTVAKGPFVFSEALTPQLADELAEALMFAATQVRWAAGNKP